MKVFFHESMNRRRVKRGLVLFFFSFSMGPLVGQENVKSSTFSDTLNRKTNAPVERKAIDPALKHNPAEFYIINDKPVSKEEYLESLKLKQTNK